MARQATDVAAKFEEVAVAGTPSHNVTLEEVGVQTNGVLGGTQSLCTWALRAELALHDGGAQDSLAGADRQG